MTKKSWILAAPLVLLAGGAAAQGAPRGEFLEDGPYALVMGASRNDMNVVASLVNETGRDLNIIDSSGRTALDYAAAYDNVGMAKLLLAHGAKVDARDKMGDTALHWAAQRSNMQVMEVLIDAKATIDAQNAQGLTPLMIAAEDDQVRAVRLLLKNGADPKKDDFTGRDATQWAASNPAVLELLTGRR